MLASRTVTVAAHAGAVAAKASEAPRRASVRGARNRKVMAGFLSIAHAKRGAHSQPVPRRRRRFVDGRFAALLASGAKAPGSPHRKMGLTRWHGSRCFATSAPGEQPRSADELRDRPKSVGARPLQPIEDDRFGGGAYGSRPLAQRDAGQSVFFAP